MILVTFDFQVARVLPTKFRVNWPFVSGKETQIHFQDSRHGGYLGFSIRTNLATCDPQVTLIFPTKFRISWRFGSRDEAQNRFSRWRSWLPSWISIQNTLSYF